MQVRGVCDCMCEGRAVSRGGVASRVLSFPGRMKRISVCDCGYACVQCVVFGLICVCTCIYVCNIYVFMCVCIYMCIYIYTYIYIHIYKYAYIHLYTHTCICTYIRIIHARVRTYIYTFIHT
jgi:hypothetical protein